jgi:hypothetical protein
MIYIQNKELSKPIRNGEHNPLNKWAEDLNRGFPKKLELENK